MMSKVRHQRSPALFESHPVERAEFVNGLAAER